MQKKISLSISFIVLIVAVFIHAQNFENSNVKTVITLDELLKIRKDIQYIPMYRDVQLTFNKLIFFDEKNLSEDDLVPFAVRSSDRFVVSIPHGCVYLQKGFIEVDDMYVSELMWRALKNNDIFTQTLKKPKKIDGRVAVITQGGAWCYYHWMVEVLPRFLLLQKSGIAYDYLYVSLESSFMKETLELLGMDMAKIIEPVHENGYIQADELIVPSLFSFGDVSQHAIDCLREKFISLAQNLVDQTQFSKRIFISRQSSSRRKIKNEDDIFALFQEHGFERYNLEELSFLEQVALFDNAEFIVGEHGAGFTNIIFSQPKTQVVEIFQAKKNELYCYLSQQLNLQYTSIKTIEFYAKGTYSAQLTIPLDQIQIVINKLLK